MMVLSHQFGGPWTEEKLSRLKNYLREYTKIFARSSTASWYRTTYLDAFAGTGYRTKPPASPVRQLRLIEDEDAREFKKGSAWIALEVEPPFDEYVFVEHNPLFAAELHKLREQFPERKPRIKIFAEEANSFIKAWCRETDWGRNRAVVFLDPYGMEVEWATLEIMAATGAIDLWLLFPLGQAINCMLTRGKIPEGNTARRLDLIFGTPEWRSASYRERQQFTLLGPRELTIEEVRFREIGKFFVDRLNSIFAKTAKNPLPLRNSKNVPIFLLCFASANPKGAGIAVRIAQHVLRERPWQTSLR
jgi:three-Cys-motif partner protein